MCCNMCKPSNTVQCGSGNCQRVQSKAGRWRLSVRPVLTMRRRCFQAPGIRSHHSPNLLHVLQILLLDDIVDSVIKEAERSAEVSGLTVGAWRRGEGGGGGG